GVIEKSAFVIRLSLLTNNLVFIASTFNQLSLIYKYRQQLATTEPNNLACDFTIQGKLQREILYKEWLICYFTDKYNLFLVHFNYPPFLL
uniref:hypothetical protein n=1 Tax=Psychromonas hadalis TaxID=211669 RepID=UPI00048FBB85